MPQPLSKCRKVKTLDQVRNELRRKVWFSMIFDTNSHDI